MPGVVNCAPRVSRKRVERVIGAVVAKHWRVAAVPVDLAVTALSSGPGLLPLLLIRLSRAARNASTVL